ncbi:MAG TPA: T3SS effector HopA1 family protein [Pyrinomonadaceae bacterium]|nr:T3SS effector HopA1 family protein [Pyrinomonadaceae bacterium]
MEEQLVKDLLQIVRAVKVRSPVSLSFAGNIRSLPLPDDQQEDAATLPRRSAMIQHLGRELYCHCYSRKFTGTAAEVAKSSADEQFVNELSAANSSREYLDRGWRIMSQLPTGHYIAGKNGFTRILFAGEFISHSDFRGPIQEGTSISIFCPRESKTMHPGFYYVFGETVGDQQDDSGLLRFYWNIQTDGAMSLVRLLTERLNRFQLPFRFKIVNNPTCFDRSDAAILYVNQRYYHPVAELIAEVRQKVSDQLECDTPLFSKQLAPGLGLAEEPTTGESFGQQRCRILAEALWNIYEQNLNEDETQLNEIRKQLELNGINADLPYLNAGSSGDYDFSFS